MKRRRSRGTDYPVVESQAKEVREAAQAYGIACDVVSVREAAAALGLPVADY